MRVPHGSSRNASLKRPGHVAQRRGDLDAGGLELLHLRVEVGEREADVIDGAAGARLRGGVSQEHEARAAEHQAIGRLGDALAAEMLLVHQAEAAAGSGTFRWM